MTIPYTFAGATTAIPLANLDANFASPITLGNVAMTLSNTYNSSGNLTLTNVTISSASGLAANTVAYANASGVLGGSANMTFNGTNLYLSSPAGFGATSPSYPVEVLADANAIGVSLRGRSADNLSLYNFTNNTGATQYGYILGSPSELRLAQNGANYITAYTNSAERMRITSTGQVGIGTSSPGSILNAQQSSAADALFILQNANTGGYASAISLRVAGATGTSYNYIEAYDTVNSVQQWAIGGRGNQQTLCFTTGSGERMRIDSGGNVGIGTSSPATRLQISSATSTGLLITNTGGAASYTQFANTGGSAYIGSNNNDMQFLTGAAGTERMRIDSSGNLLVGTTSAGARVSIAFSSNSGPSIISNDTTPQNGNTFHQFRNNGTTCGSITSNGTTTTTYGTSSDYRLKDNVVPMIGALATVAQLKPVTYKWKADGSDGQGFIAHELQAIVPDCVTGEKDAVDEEGNPKYQGIDTSFLVATLTAAIQEQQALITNLTTRLTALENK